jgi:hypothetical protein
MIIDLNDDNYIIFAAKAYEKPSVVQSEFEEDLNRISYIKRLLSKYYSSGQLKERLLLNHIVIFLNVFGIVPGNRLLFLKLDKMDWTVIKPFLVFIDSLPPVIENIRGKDIPTDVIPLDKKVIEALRQINNGK